ncbi:MAG: hypothetical protein L0H63_13375 [Nitrococcus sp.]|nr:hypothetical protein [Nitrococcus sp.]
MNVSARARGLALFGFAATGLAGCSSLLMDNPNEVGDAYRVEPQIEWSRQQGYKLQIWTVDGPLLEQLRLYANIEEGDRLLPTTRTQAGSWQGGHWPEYRQGMRAHDVMELVTATLQQSGSVDVVAKRLRPAEFGGRPGFRFELRFESENGLAYQGRAMGIITEDERLHLILYLGAQPYYFGAYEAIVQRILDSVILL